jgi:DNA polymerase III epsilon subunit family exonuclease
MDKLKKFIDYLNEKTCNKFNFLKLKQVFFDTSHNLLSVDFIYPADQNITDDDRKQIFDVIKSYINVDVNLKLEIDKSYVEPDIVAKQIKNYFETNHKMFFNTFNFDNLLVSCDIDKVKVNFKLEKNLQNFFDEFNVDKKLQEFLTKNFCAEFELSTSLVTDSQLIDEDYLQKRINKIREKNDFDSILSFSQDKYFVADKKAFVGGEITFNPRFIRTINRIFDSCVIAGKLNFLTEKTFKKKTKKLDESGAPIVEDKPYFSFQIKDDTGSLNGVIFPTKANYHKMHLLKNGDTVAVQGRISKFNENFEIMADKISFCTIPNKDEIEVVDQNLIADYRFVRPQKYYMERQSTLFDDRHLSKEAKAGSFVVYDFETTGIDFNKEEIIEIGALKIVNGEYREVFTTLVKPSKHIPEEATKVNRITDEMVANSHPIEQVIRDFYLFCKGSQLVGYNNIFFDKQFLDKAAGKVGINFDNQQIDALSLARQKLNGLKHYNLSSVAKFLEVNLIDAHRALNDVIATAEVFLKLY